MSFASTTLKPLNLAPIFVIAVWLLATGAPAQECCPELAVELLRVAEGQAARNSHDRARAIAADILPCLTDPVHRWRARLVELEARVNRSSSIAVVEKQRIVAELEGLLIEHADGDIERKVRTLQVIARLSEDTSAQEAAERAIRLATSDPVRFAGRIGPMLQYLSSLRTGRRSGCLIIRRPATPSLLLELAGVELHDQDRTTWWQEVAEAIGSHERDEAINELVRLVRTRAASDADQIPVKVLLAVARVNRSNQPQRRQMLELTMSRDAADEHQLAAARKALEDMGRQRISVRSRGRTFATGEPVEVELSASHVDRVMVDVKALAMIPGTVQPAAANGHGLAGFAVIGDPIRSQTFNLDAHQERQEIRLEPLPVGAWRLSFSAGSASAEIDIRVTEATWMIWVHGEQLVLAVVDVHTGRPLAGVPVRLGAVADSELRWLHELRSNELGLISVPGAALCSATAMMIAIDGGHRWLPWGIRGCPRPGIPVPPQQRRGCWQSRAWLQLVVDNGRLVPGEPFPWRLLVSGMDEPDCWPSELRWSVHGQRITSPLAEGTVSISPQGWAAGEIVPDDDWPAGAVDLVFAAPGDLRLNGARWRLGWLHSDGPPAGLKDIALSYTPADRQAVTGEALRVHLKVGDDAPGWRVWLQVREYGGYGLPGARPALASVGQRPRNNHAIYATGHDQSRLLLNQELELLSGLETSFELPWPEVDNATLVATVRAPDLQWVDLQYASVTVIRRDSIEEVSLHTHSRHDVAAGQEPVVVLARDMDRSPSQRHLQLELRSPPSSRERAADSSMPVRLDGSGMAVVQVPFDDRTEVRIVDEDGRNLNRTYLYPPNGANRRDVSIELRPWLVHDRDEVEVVIRSPGDGRFALLTIGDQPPSPLILDRPRLSRTITIGDSEDDRLEIQVHSLRAGRLAEESRRFVFRRDLTPGWLDHSLEATVNENGLMVSSEPPSRQAGATVLAGEPLWPPIILRKPDNSRGLARGSVRVGEVIVPLSSAPTASPAAITTKDATPTPKPKPTATPDPDEPQLPFVLTLATEPLTPARLWCAVPSVDIDAHTKIECPEQAGTPSTVIVSNPFPPHDHRFVEICGDR